MTAAGYTQGSDGKWVDGSGNTVVMQIHVRGGEEDQIRIAPILSDQLNAAGFDASFKITEAGALYDGIARGDILTNLQLVGGNAINVSDPWGTFDLLHSRYSAPIGQIATGQRSRFENAEFDNAVDAMSKITTGDPQMKDLFRTAMEIILREMPIVPLVQTALLTPNNYTYWTNWPDFQDQTNPHNYYSPSQWWGSFYHSILNIKPTNA
jgi:peptide/nickel transport system substrate-binding protein